MPLDVEAWHEMNRVRPMAGQTPRRLRFCRRARIKQGRDFQRVRQSGDRLVCGCLIANWQRLQAEAASRLGVITSRRIGGAVVRNRMEVPEHALAVGVPATIKADASDESHIMAAAALYVDNARRYRQELRVL